MPLQSVITYGPYTSEAISSRISTKTTLILMTDMFSSSSMRFCMNDFGVPTVATYKCSCVSTMHVSRTDTVATACKLASSLDMKFLCVLPPSTVLTFRMPSLFSLRKMWDSRIFPSVIWSSPYYVEGLVCPSYGVDSSLSGLLFYPSCPTS